VTRLDPATTEEDIIVYMKDKQTCVEKVEKLNARYDTYALMR